NILVMTVYSLWTNWLTLFLVERHHLDPGDANTLFAWIPPVFGAAGGLFGGWLSLTRPKLRVMLYATIALIATALVPIMRSPSLATAMISFSFFACLAASANLYGLTQDLFGPQRAAFAVAAITMGFGLMQSAYLPLVGRMVDLYGFGPVCATASVLPLAGW